MAITTIFVVLAAAAPVATDGVIPIDGVVAPTVQENHEGGIIAEDYVNGVAPSGY
ncbi:hypothetical protein EG328_006380 [Venturia inaequalis]|uniref:Secreted protein n=1 Tax=Venturia inaequalis TaxID=5025 RepID=A0A8H3UWM6_VENIN|nr:hypothetical protein EG328_006380 [Venturia inaequalis]KAE9976114.1 hypothetical protein EG327_008219 [Venturia inaequalis]